MTSYRHAPLSIGRDYGDPPPFFHLFYSGARHIYRYISSLFFSTEADSGKRGRRKAPPWQPKSLLSLSTALILIWMLAIWSGEQGVFQRKIKDCDWQQWERW
ncbi:MAG: hypothetical protein Q9228_005208, partial [Teloschistes exilis]